MRKAYGGIVINFRGQVLLREPAGHYKGDVWTFAKGRPVPGETPEQTALREMLEETGYQAEIAAKIPGCFNGKRTSNEYFLMLPVEDTGQFDAETQAIRWASAEEARQLIQLNRKPNRRRRDLRVLKLALALFRSFERAIDVSPKPGHRPAVCVGVAESPAFSRTAWTALPSRGQRRQLEMA
jgi:8-oxo-dGTP diphosphatase